MEIWHEIPGYGGWYEASNQGRIRSWRLPGNGSRRAPAPHPMSESVTSDGYKYVPLVASGRTYLARVNRLVLMTFIGKPRPGARACHRNGNHTDNRLENLFWASQAEEPGVGSEPSLTSKQVARIRELYATGEYSHRVLARRYAVSKTTIWRAINGRKEK